MIHARRALVPRGMFAYLFEERNSSTFDMRRLV
jgi:hypothetical protein